MMFIPLISFLFFVWFMLSWYVCKALVCLSLPHWTNPHNSVFTQSFCFSFTLYPSFPLFLLHSSLLFLLISFMFTSLFLPRNVPADIPNLFFFLHPFISLPSNTLVLLFCLHLKLPLSLFLSSVLVSVERLWLHRHTDSRMCCWGGLLFWDSPWR